MSNTLESVLADALRLDPSARAQIAAELLASLDMPADPDAEAAWTAEIEKRVAELDSGTADLESWDDVRRWIEATLLKR